MRLGRRPWWSKMRICRPTATTCPGPKSLRGLWNTPHMCAHAMRDENTFTKL